VVFSIHNFGVITDCSTKDVLDRAGIPQGVFIWMGLSFSGR